MQLHHHADELATLSLRVVVVSFEEPDRARQWTREGDLGFPMLLDPERAAYRAFELKRSFWRTWHPRAFWFYLGRLARGRKLAKPGSDLHQMGGDFIIDARGVLRFAYYSRDSTDRPEVSALLAVTREIVAG